MAVTPIPPETEEFGYDEDNEDNTSPSLREEDPNIEAKLNGIFAALPVLT